MRSVSSATGTNSAGLRVRAWDAPSAPAPRSRRAFRREIDDRLVDESQLLLLEGAPQVALERGAAVLLGAHRRR